MKRREFLASLATGTASLAGCAESRVSNESTPSSPATAAIPLARHGTPPDICEQNLLDVGIYAIDEPAFAPNWSDREIDGRYAPGGHLTDDMAVIGLKHGGRPRAYPVSVLWHHEIVNDTFGLPVIVTYCSLCRSGMVAERVVDGTATRFGVSGQLWVPPELETRVAEADGRVFAVEGRDTSPGAVRNTGNLVMYDQLAVGYWSQLLARAICGPHQGTTLGLVPSTATTWGDWRATHPATDVLLPPPHSTLIRSFP